jgi:hypothetical protein
MVCMILKITAAAHTHTLRPMRETKNQLYLDDVSLSGGWHAQLLPRVGMPGMGDFGHTTLIHGNLQRKQCQHHASNKDIFIPNFRCFRFKSTSIGIRNQISQDPSPPLHSFLLLICCSWKQITYHNITRQYETVQNFLRPQNRSSIIMKL